VPNNTAKPRCGTLNRTRKINGNLPAFEQSAQYRRLRTRLGAPKAITAMAHKPARLVYRMLTYGQD